METISKKLWENLILACMLLSLVIMGCTKSEKADSESKKTDEGYYYYEAIFLDNEEINDLFCQVRGEQAPYEQLTENFHVTTKFKPEETHSQWYGEKVDVHITAYKAQEIKDDDGNPTYNEGFKVSVTADNAELENYLESLDNLFHITGSYQDGAKYTDRIDFSDGKKLDLHTTGTFGCGDSDGTIDLGN